jgi:hypothetical protein
MKMMTVCACAVPELMLTPLLKPLARLVMLQTDRCQQLRAPS